MVIKIRAAFGTCERHFGKAGWNMGEGRMPPPLSYDAFLPHGIHGSIKAVMLLNIAVCKK